jgi:hypothetical protein
LSCATIFIGACPIPAIAQSSGAESRIEATPAAQATEATGTISGTVSFGEKTRLKNGPKELVNVVVSVEDVELSKEQLAASRAAKDTPVID